MGDKTQLLAMLLAIKLSASLLPIIVGHSCGHTGQPRAGRMLWANSVAQALGPDVLRWVIGLSFLAMAGWMLVPDQDGQRRSCQDHQRWVSLPPRWWRSSWPRWATRRRSQRLLWRHASTIWSVWSLAPRLGMMLANVPAVYFGDAISRRVSMPLVHGVAALIFAVLGVLTLVNFGHLFG
jgi:putative Ca2+/H+ antiporter (TMEM165/GDT1 family)